MRSLSGASLTLGSLGLAATIGCSQVGMVQARRDFKAANAAYQQQDYKKAAELYEQTLSEDSSLTEAYFFLGNSYDNQFKPSRRGELEITDVNNHYLKQGRMGYSVLDGYWTDAGTLDSLDYANELVRKEPPRF